MYGLLNGATFFMCCCFLPPAQARSVPSTLSRSGAQPSFAISADYDKQLTESIFTVSAGSRSKCAHILLRPLQSPSVSSRICIARRLSILVPRLRRSADVTSDSFVSNSRGFYFLENILLHRAPFHSLSRAIKERKRENKKQLFHCDRTTVKVFFSPLFVTRYFILLSETDATAEPNFHDFRRHNSHAGKLLSPTNENDEHNVTGTESETRNKGRVRDGKS